MAIAETVISFNWFDWVVTALIFLYAWQGWDHELYIVGSELVSWVGAWLGGLLFSERLAQLLVGAFGLWPQSSWLWSLILLVVIIQQVIYRGLQLVLMKLPKAYLPKLVQFGFGLFGSLGAGFLVILFLVLVAVKIPVVYPWEEDVKGGFWGKNLVSWVDAGHKLLLGTELNMGLQ